MSVRNPKLQFKDAMRWEGEVENYIQEVIKNYVTICAIRQYLDYLRLQEAEFGLR